MKKLAKQTLTPKALVVQAESLYETILTKPRDPEGYLKLTALLEEKNRFIEALDIYSQGLRNIPGHGLLQMNYGLLLYKLGEVETAKKLMESARDLLTSPDPAEVKAFKALKALGLSQIQTMQFPAALKTFQELVRIKPKHNNNLYLLGTLFQRLHKFNKARHAYKQLLAQTSFETKPGLVSKAYYNLATIASMAPKDSGFDQAYASDRQVNPQIDLHFYHFTRLIEAREPAEVIAHYRAYLASNPEDSKLALICCRLGMLLRAQGDEPGAKEAFLKALEQDPDCVLAHYQLSFLLAEHGDLDGLRLELAKIVPLHEEAAYQGFEPTDLFDPVLKLLESGQDPSLVDLAALAQIQLQASQFEAARNSFETLLQAEPDHSRHLCRLGAALQGLGLVDEAGSAYQQVLEQESFDSNPQLVSV
ncbi:MAG: tetratricopeptide repeat protein, partial [Candidatus Sericytochromatia bacterium]